MDRLRIRRTLTIALDGDFATVNDLMTKITVAAAQAMQGVDLLHERWSNDLDVLDEQGQVIPRDELVRAMLAYRARERP